MVRSLVLAAALAIGALPGHLRAQPPALPPASADDPFARRAWQLELGTYGALETWNYNGSHEELSAIVPGVGYGLGKGVVLVGRGLLSYIGQRGPDGFLLGTTIGARGRIFRRRRWSLFWEADIGISHSDTVVPRRGTRFNYLALGGVGTTVHLAHGLHLLSGLRWIHISNAGLAGRDRNPDIEAVGVQMGVLVGF
jgi:hypothetical protein